jgi:hypothetical protein
MVCPFKKRKLLDESTTSRRLKINTVYRRMQKALTQYVELRDCGMHLSIPDLNLDVFNSMDEFLG